MKYFIFLFLFFSGCTLLQYEKDDGFIPSGIARATEFPVRINNIFCVDTELKPGACIFNLPRNKDIFLYIQPMGYAYRLEFKCSKNMIPEEDFPIDKRKGKEFNYIIAKDFFAEMNSFTCAGIIYPQNRDLVQMRFRVHVILKDGNYAARESAYEYEKHIVLGKHALYVQCYKNGKWKRYRKKTFIRKDDITTCFSESWTGRINWFNLAGVYDF